MERTGELMDRQMRAYNPVEFEKAEPFEPVKSVIRKFSTFFDQIFKRPWT